MGFSASKHPIPLLTSPLKGEGQTNWLKIVPNQEMLCGAWIVGVLCVILEQYYKIALDLGQIIGMTLVFSLETPTLKGEAT